MTAPEIHEPRVDVEPSDCIVGLAVRPGPVLPFGASRVRDGLHFSIPSRDASQVTLVLYRIGESEPFAEIPIPEDHRVGGVHSVVVQGLDADAIEYGYRVDGPADAAEHDRFDPDVVLVDPYARALSGRDVWATEEPMLRAPYRGRVPRDDFDWEGDRPLRRPIEELVVYEAHVRGFTRHPSSGVADPGTFAGLVEKIPYLHELGVNCVELMPVFEFDELENSRSAEDSGRVLLNYWGYSTVGFFAPKAGFAATGAWGMQVDELKNLIKQLHRAGIEVVLDVVFNHTAEGDERGPALSFRGLDNRTFYMLDDAGHYMNFSGTGNTVNGNHPVVRRFVLDCLRHWAAEYHVDGFRFDLAAILGRGEDGTPLPDPPLLSELAHDPVLQDCKMIAEAWDAGGLYQVGTFPAYGRWAEWNGKFRDAARAFVKGDAGLASELAARIVGSPDLYGGRGPRASVNFVTAHDGFSLHDLVSYDEKHNEANGEGNRDGDDHNLSWNCGAEGPTGDPEILALRARQMRNLLVVLLCSRGVPMIVAGDEVARTQRGNNNAYCHDDELSWFDWSHTTRDADLLRFVRVVVALRRELRVLRWPEHPTGTPGEPGSVTWHGEGPGEPDWHPEARLIAVTLHGEPDDPAVYLALNAHWSGRDVALPRPPAGTAWHVAVDTAAPAPADAHPCGAEPVTEDRRRLAARASLVLVARPASD